MQEEDRSSLGLGKNRIDLVSYLCPCDMAATISDTTLLGFMAIYPRFMTNLPNLLGSKRVCFFGCC
jgi:hypothetical protein